MLKSKRVQVNEKSEKMTAGFDGTTSRKKSDWSKYLRYPCQVLV
jgi:hypothetical protein